MKVLKVGSIIYILMVIIFLHIFVHNLIDLDALVRLIWLIGQDMGHMNLKLDILIVNFS